MTPAVPRETGRRVGPDEQYAQVPQEVITDPALGHAAVRVWAYCWLVTGRKHWILRKSDICARVGVGDNAWTKAIRELTRAGLYELRRDRFPAGSVDADGDSCGGQTRIEHVIYWPGFGPTGPSHSISTAPPKTGRRRTASPKAGGRRSTPGNTAVRREGGLSTYKEININQEAEASRARDVVANAAASGMQQIVRPRKVTRPSGIVCWNEDDLTAAPGIEATYRPEEVTAGVAAAKKKMTKTGKPQSPTPGVVENEILLARAAHEKAKRAKAQEEVGALAELRRHKDEMAQRYADPVARQAADNAARRSAEDLGFKEPGVGLVT